VLDKDKQKIGSQVGRLRILDIARLPEVVQKHPVQIAIIAVPSEEAQEVADLLIKNGIKAILTYAPITLTLPSDVRVQHIDPVVVLQSMTYYLNSTQP